MGYVASAGPARDGPGPAASARRQRSRRLTIVAVVLLTALLALTPTPALDEIDTTRLRNAVTVSGILAHERVFQRIANQNGGTRASGMPGYDASADYVK
jgi:hypothetical protein